MKKTKDELANAMKCKDYEIARLAQRVTDREMLACMFYHAGEASVAEVHGRLCQEADTRAHWNHQRNLHRLFGDALSVAKKCVNLAAAQSVVFGAKEEER